MKSKNMKNVWFTILLFTVSFGFAQKVKISVNGKYYSNNTVCLVVPNSLCYAFSDKKTKISKGKFSLTRGRLVVKEITIDTTNAYLDSLKNIYSYIKPNDKLILDVEEVLVNNIVKKNLTYSLIRFGDLTPEIDIVDLLINNSVLYKKNRGYFRFY